jgi:hypothetical protein
MITVERPWTPGRDLLQHFLGQHTPFVSLAPKFAIDVIYLSLLEEINMFCVMKSSLGININSFGYMSDAFMFSLSFLLLFVLLKY